MKRTGMITLAAFLLLGGGAAVAVDIEQVAIRGDTPETGTEYIRFRRPAIGDAPTTPVTFKARVKGDQSGWGIFVDGAGGMADGSLVQLKNDPAPESREFKKFDNSTINDDGNVTFTAKLSGGSEGVFRENDGLVALRGDDLSTAVPPVTGLLSRVSNKHGPEAQVTDDGDVVFHATILDPAQVSGVDIDEGVFRCTGGDGDCSGGTGTLETLVLRNDPVPDRAGREICSIVKLAASTFGTVMLADTQLDCADGGELPLRGVFRMPFGGAIVTVALAGEVAEPDVVAPTTTYGIFTTEPQISNDGTVVFKALTGGEEVKWVLYLCPEATCPAALPAAVVEEGDVPPPGPEGGTSTYSSFGTPVVADGELMAFKAKARGTTGTFTAIYWREAGGMVERLLRLGDQVLGMTPTSQWKRLYKRIDISPGGKLAFHAKVRAVSPGASSPRSREGIFLADLTSSPSGAFLEPGAGVLD